MTALLDTIWIAAIFFPFAVAKSQDCSIIKNLKNASFQCNLDIDDRQWIIQCESGIIRVDKNFTSNYRVQVEKNQNILNYIHPKFNVKLEGIFYPSAPFVFEQMLNSTLSSKSKLNICYFSDIFQYNPSSHKYLCTDCSKYIDKFINFANRSSVVRAEITCISNYEIVKNIFREFSHLTEVKIYNNTFQNVTNLSKDPKTLRILILENNSIEYVSQDTFHNLHSLTILDLSNNHLRYVNKNSLGYILKLRILDLSFNLIETISNDAFSNIVMLEKLYMQSNKLQDINELVFQSTTSLKTVDISNNNLTKLPSKIFHNLQNLENVSCSNCNLYNLNSELFQNLTKIRFLTFSHNHLSFIPKDILKNLNLLDTLDLGFNNIKTLNTFINKQHSYLKFLNLTSNDISSFQEGCFDDAGNVLFIDLSDNKIEEISDAHVKYFKDLEYFDLTNNRIQTVELGQTNNIFIRRLFLSNNSISNLKIRWKSLLYLELIRIDNNLLTSLELPPCIPSVKQTITFSFKNNNISRLSLNYLLSDENKVEIDRNMAAGCFFNGMSKNFVDLTNNPLNCDCYMYPFYKYIKGKSSRRYQLENILNKGNLTCSMPQSHANEFITSLNDDSFSCAFSNDCPFPCTCAIRGKDNMRFLNCSANNMQEVPQQVPKGTTVLYFNRNNLKSMLSLNSKYFNDIAEFHFDDNFLTDLNDWHYPMSLRFLSVRGNKLKTLPSPLMNFIANQSNFQLYFGGNDENCTCDSEKLKTFLLNNKKFVGDIEQIVCKVTNNGTQDYLPLISVPDSELCPLYSNEPNYKLKRIIISLCLFFTFLILVVLTYYRHRQLILSFFYIHCDELYRFFYREGEYDEDKIFDAFVAYSSNDRNIVIEMLQKLESQPPHFKLCIHERNWLPGRFICDNILSSVNSCKRIIIILSDSFIASPWFNLELRAAVSRMAKEKINRIIVVLTEKNVSLSNVDPEIRHVISKRTYLVWKERWFWEKLRYSMPRINPKHSNHALMSPSRRRNSELFLIAESV